MRCGVGVVSAIMRPCLNPVLAGFLAFVVALSSVTMAQARHHPRAAGVMELCTGIGMIAVSVDAQGNPVGPMLPCPDCTPAAFALPDGGVRFDGPAQRLVALQPRPVMQPAPDLRMARTRHARAPPFAA